MPALLPGTPPDCSPRQALRAEPARCTSALSSSYCRCGRCMPARMPAPPSPRCPLPAATGRPGSPPSGPASSGGPPSGALLPAPSPGTSCRPTPTATRCTHFSSTSPSGGGRRGRRRQPAGAAGWPPRCGRGRQRTRRCACCQRRMPLARAACPPAFVCCTQLPERPVDRGGAAAAARGRSAAGAGRLGGWLSGLALLCPPSAAAEP